MYKVVIVGNSGTGKTSILNRYVYNKFDTLVPSTIGVEFLHKDHDDTTKLVLWDTAGQERFQSIVSSFYKGAQAIMFVYDVSSRESFDSIIGWWREYKSHGNIQKSVALLVGNKADLERIVPKEEALALAVQYGMYYEEVSAFNNSNVNNAFETLVRLLKQLPAVRQEKQKKREMPTSDRCCY